MSGPKPNLQEVERQISRLKREYNGPHTMIEDLSSHLHWFRQEIARLKKQARSLREKDGS